jgi:menaquinone-dependent protoporphyrinogen IX oxidase/Pyruvate/2-oxoacid:ferredoxin oxidoreductase delta subunit
MKCIIYFFTGSGHTRMAAEDIKKHLDEGGCQTDLYEFKEPVEKFPDPNDYDVVGIGYPIHAFNIPDSFFGFIKKKLPAAKEKGKKVFIFKVSGEPFHPNDASSYLALRHLRRKGYNPVLEKHLLMPYNIMFKYPANLAKQMYLYLDPLCQVIAKKILGGEETKLKYKAIHHVNSWFFRIERVAGPVNCVFFHVKKKKCVNCNQCIKNCPNNSLYRSKNGRIKCHPSCNICMRCTMSCPKNAIVFGFMNPWKVNPLYPYKEYAADSSIKGDQVNKNTKGYFKHFRKYFKAQNEELTKYGIQIPVSYPKGEEL